jgi:hypothetical protein
MSAKEIAMVDNCAEESPEALVRLDQQYETAVFWGVVCLVAMVAFVMFDGVLY